jgi:hypothetical protein
VRSNRKTNCKKLQRTTLAIKKIGTLLRSKDVKERDIALRSELWDLSLDETDILPALGLSYKDFLLNLK